MAHGHSNHPYYCRICEHEIVYGDESPPDFCSSLCEGIFENDWACCDKCGEDFPKAKLQRTSGDYAFCKSCMEEEEEE